MEYIDSVDEAVDRYIDGVYYKREGKKPMWYAEYRVLKKGRFDYTYWKTVARSKTGHLSYQAACAALIREKGEAPVLRRNKPLRNYRSTYLPTISSPRD